MEAIRKILDALPTRERQLAVLALFAAGGGLGWLVGRLTGLSAGLILVANLVAPNKAKDLRDSDDERERRDLQRKRRELIALLAVHDAEKEGRVAPPTIATQSSEEPTPAPRAVRAAPAVLFPPDPRPLPPALPRADLFKGAPPPDRPIVEEASRLFRRSRRSGSIVE